MSIYERIAAVMTDVTYLTRDCDMGEYWTLSDEKITSAVRASLIKKRSRHNSRGGRGADQRCPDSHRHIPYTGPQ